MDVPPRQPIPLLPPYSSATPFLLLRTLSEVNVGVDLFPVSDQPLKPPFPANTWPAGAGAMGPSGLGPPGTAFTDSVHRRADVRVPSFALYAAGQ